VTDSNGETVWRGASTAWGRSLRESTPVNWDTPQNLRVQGQYLDRETGLHYNTFRYYDPASGCYTQMDPIGLLGGLNTYTYVVDPLGWVDPLGLSETRQQLPKDKTVETSRAARREAMKSAKIPTSQSYQVQFIEDASQSELSKLNTGVLHEERIMQNGKEIGRVKVYHEGHIFEDDGTFENLIIMVRMVSIFLLKKARLETPINIKEIGAFNE